MKVAVVSLLCAVWAFAVGIDANVALIDDQVYSSPDDVQIVVNDMIAKDLSISSDARSSSQCWLSSIMALTRWDNVGANNPFTSGSSLCAAMTEDRLDILALELTHCQLSKLGRDTFSLNPTQSEAMPSCQLGRADQSQPYQVSSCLQMMTDIAVPVYNQIRLHTENLCSQLAEEILQQQREKTMQLVIHATSSFAQHIQAVMKGTASTVEQLNYQSLLLQNQSIIMKEHQSELEQMYKSRKLEEAERQIELEVIYKARKLEEAEADRVRKMREEGTLALLQHQTSIMKNQQAEFEDMYNAREQMMENKVKERMKELEQIQQMIAAANSQIKPLSTIEAYVQMATDGFAVFKTLLNFFVSLNLVWIFTSLPFLSRARRILFGVFTGGCFVELVAIGHAESELILGFGGADAIEMIRYWTRTCGLVTLIVSCLTSCVLPSSADTDHHAAAIDELIRSQMEFVSNLNAAQFDNRACTEVLAGGHLDHQPKSARKYSVSKSRRSRSSERRSPAIASLPVVTPSMGAKAAKCQVKSTIARTAKAKHHSTIDSLKEMQRDHTDDDSCDDFMSSQSECSSTSCNLAKGNRKRKFADIWDDSHEETLLHGSQNEEDSISSISGSESSLADSKKPKTAD